MENCTKILRIPILLLSRPGNPGVPGGCGQPRLHVGPGSHVLRLLLHPHHLCPWETSQLSSHQVVGERRDLEWRHRRVVEWRHGGGTESTD